MVDLLVLGRFLPVGRVPMVVIIGIAATVLFIILWRTGFLDDLVERAGAGGDREGNQERKRLKDNSLDPEMAKRLEVFEEFMEDLPDDNEE
jgi:hypothetical protein